MEMNFDIENLGKRNIPSPVLIEDNDGDGFADYVNDDNRILFDIATSLKGDRAKHASNLSLEIAGPRQKIFFNPSHTKAAICTCGGICPGLNNVIRSVVRCLWYGYGVKRIYGIRFGYRGLLNSSEHSFIDLNPDIVDDIQEKGGTILGSSRGGGENTEEIVDTIERSNINVLFTIGGDGTLRGAKAICEEIGKRGLKIAVVGIPKTIDNDLAHIQSSFGFDTAVSQALPVIRCAHIEAKNAINGIGLVKVMGRASGFIAAHASLAQSDVNFCLIPENPFDLDGDNGLLVHLRKRLLDRGHAVILVAEGAGQDLMEQTGMKDESGNIRYNDIGLFLKDKIVEYFKTQSIRINMKYIDPSYIIRSAPADSFDSIYCARLGSHAVHAAMAGKTSVLVSMLNNHFVHMPIREAVANRSFVDIKGALWRDVLENTRQPFSMKNS